MGIEKNILEQNEKAFLQNYQKTTHQKKRSCKPS